MSTKSRKLFLSIFLTLSLIIFFTPKVYAENTEENLNLEMTLEYKEPETDDSQEKLDNQNNKEIDETKEKEEKEEKNETESHELLEEKVEDEVFLDEEIYLESEKTIDKNFISKYPNLKKLNISSNVIIENLELKSLDLVINKKGRLFLNSNSKIIGCRIENHGILETESKAQIENIFLENEKLNDFKILSETVNLDESEVNEEETSNKTYYKEEKGKLEILEDSNLDIKFITEEKGKAQKIKVIGYDEHYEVGTIINMGQITITGEKLNLEKLHIINQGEIYIESGVLNQVRIENFGTIKMDETSKLKNFKIINKGNFKYFKKGVEYILIQGETNELEAEVEDEQEDNKEDLDDEEENIVKENVDIWEIKNNKVVNLYFEDEEIKAKVNGSNGNIIKTGLNQIVINKNANVEMLIDPDDKNDFIIDFSIKNYGKLKILAVKNTSEIKINKTIEEGINAVTEVDPNIIFDIKKIKSDEKEIKTSDYIIKAINESKEILDNKEPITIKLSKDVKFTDTIYIGSNKNHSHGDYSVLIDEDQVLNIKSDNGVIFYLDETMKNKRHFIIDENVDLYFENIVFYGGEDPKDIESIDEDIEDILKEIPKKIDNILNISDEITSKADIFIEEMESTVDNVESILKDNTNVKNLDKIISSITDENLSNYLDSISEAYDLDVIHDSDNVAKISDAITEQVEKLKNLESKGIGGGILNKTESLTINDCDFISNYKKASLEEEELGGGAILNMGNIRFKGSSDFINNSSSAELSPQIDYASKEFVLTFGGGAIFNQDEITFEGNSLFINNTFSDSNSFSKTERLIKFSYFSGGGAIFNQGELVFKKNSLFINNKFFNKSKPPQTLYDDKQNHINKILGGGAILNYNAYLSFNSPTNFINNFAKNKNLNQIAGGAILNSVFRSDPNDIIFNSNVNFIGNYCESNFANPELINLDFVKGGAISNSQTLKWGITEEGNSDYIRFMGKISFNGPSSFINNYVHCIDNLSGGAIFNKGEITFKENSLFINNHVYSHEYSAGGAIANQHHIKFLKEANFISNYCELYSYEDTYIGSLKGGAIHNIYYYGITFEDTSNFINNYCITTGHLREALDSGGGAIANRWYTIINFNGPSNFINNRIKCDKKPDGNNHTSLGGGAIFNFNGRIFFNEATNFINNHATGNMRIYGGAICNDDIYSSYSLLVFNKKGNFINNSAYSNSFSSGGAIFNYNEIESTALMNFINNTSTSSRFSIGGAVYDTSYHPIRLQEVNFINNRCVSDKEAEGGAIYSDSISGWEYEYELIFEKVSNFINNSCISNEVAKGGAISNTKKLLFKDISNFIGNTTKSLLPYESQGGGIFHRYQDLSFELAPRFNSNYAGYYVDTLNKVQKVNFLTKEPLGSLNKSPHNNFDLAPIESDDKKGFYNLYRDDTFGNSSIYQLINPDLDSYTIVNPFESKNDSETDDYNWINEKEFLGWKDSDGLEFNIGDEVKLNEFNSGKIYYAIWKEYQLTFNDSKDRLELNNLHGIKDSNLKIPTSCNIRMNGLNEDGSLNISQKYTDHTYKCIESKDWRFLHWENPNNNVKFYPGNSIKINKDIQLEAIWKNITKIEKPEDKDPEDKDSEDKDPEDKDPEDKDPEDKDPEDKDPEDKDPEDKDPEDKDPEDGGSDGGGSGGGGSGGGGSGGGGSGGGGSGGGGSNHKDKSDKDEKLNRDDHFAYIKGYNENNVIKPEENITREEVATVFYRLLEKKYKDEITTEINEFTDVNKPRWSNKHISTLVNGQILTGYKDRSFKPINKITRAEVATIASKFSDEDKEGKEFTDIKGHWAEKNIRNAEALGWVKGYKDGSFKPDNFMSRAEFVSLVNNVLNRKVRKENILKGIKKFDDLNEILWYYEDFVESTNGHEYERLEDGTEKWIRLIDKYFE